MESTHNPAIFLLPTHIAQQAMNTGIVPTQPLQPTAIRRRVLPLVLKGWCFRASVARVGLVVLNSASRNLNRPALAELRLTSGRLGCKMQVQNPMQAPIAFEAIAAKIVWQRCLAIDAWQIFYL